MRMAMTLACVVVLAGCNGGTGVPPISEWSATLQPEAGFEGVGGSAVAQSSPGQTTVTATLTGVPAESEFPWHIHFGTCDNDQGVVGAAGAYPFLEPDAAGAATATATLNVGLVPGQPYMVNVHASPTDLATIVACGALIVD